MIVDTATLQPGEFAIDYASFQDYDAMVKLNVRCVLRYVATATGIYSWKSLRPAEVTALHSRAIGVICIWERAATTPLAGYNQGITDGRQAAASAELLGYPHGLPIIAAVDMDVGIFNLGACVQYMTGFKSGLNLQYAAGVYGDVDIINACADICSSFHLAGARSWSHGLASELVHLRQKISISTPLYDGNDVLRPLDMWLPHDESRPAPAPLPEKEDDMVIFTFKSYANAWLSTGLHLTPEGVTALVAQGAVVVTSDDHPQALRSLLHLSGLTQADLVAR